MSGDFTPEQKRYLEGFVSGVQARGGNGFLGSGNPPQAAPEPTPMGPDAPHLLAQDEAIKVGKKLVDQEKWKRDEKFGGGYAHVTTRANLQFREVAAKDAIHVVEAVQDLGLTSRGAGGGDTRPLSSRGATAPSAE